MKAKFNQQGLAPLIILLIVAAVAGGGFLGYRYFSSQNISTPPTAKQPAKVSTPSGKPTKKISTPPRSTAPGIVLAALTAHGYNPKTGSAVKPDKYFSTKDKQIYLLMNVNKPKVGTRLEYVRYLQGKYLDHKSLKVTQPNWKYAYFGWSNKAGKSHKKGIYRIRVYSNGVLEKKINYVVQNK